VTKIAALLQAVGRLAVVGYRSAADIVAVSIRRAKLYLLQPIDYSWLAVVLQSVPLMFALWSIEVNPTRPGIAVTVLGLVAAFMAVRAEHMGNLEKVGWILVACALCYAEIQAINHDREENDRQQISLQAQENAKFANVLDQNQKEFDRTMKGMRGLGELSREAINEVTGGDSFAYVAPTDFGKGMQLTVFIHGENIVHGVMYQVIEGKPPYPFSLEETLLRGSFIRLGDMAPDRMAPIDSYFRTVDPSSGAFFHIKLVSLNGSFLKGYMSLYRMRCGRMTRIIA
jgi:hypothetical protein